MKTGDRTRQRSEPRQAGAGTAEWLPLLAAGAGDWKLPSGKGLAEFALQAGFLAPPLLPVRGTSASAPEEGKDLIETAADPLSKRACR